MRHVIKNAVAVCLFPLCVGSFRTVLRIIAETGRADSLWVAVLAGVACWCVIYLMLPKPTWVYVLGHELTHALWAWLFGGRVKKFKVTSKGGYVVVTKTNFLITLSPYFVPIYVVLIVVGFALLDLIWNLRPFVVWFHLLIGAAYAFHVTLTWHALKTHQTDVSQSGYFFSGVIIWLGNVMVLLVSLPLLTRAVSLWTALRWCWMETERVWQPFIRWF